MKKLIYLSFILLITLMMTINVKAAQTTLNLECGNAIADSTNPNRKITNCDINLVVTDGIINSALTIDVKYNNPSEYNEFEIIEDGNAWVNEVIKNDFGGSIRVTPYGGQEGTFKLFTLLLYSDASSTGSDNGGTITISALGNPNTSDDGIILLDDVCNRFVVNETDFVRSGKYIYTTYYFDLNDNYHPSTCGKMVAFQGTVDTEKLPNGLKLKEGYMNNDEGTFTLNKDNGKFIIDFNDMSLPQYSNNVPENPITYDRFGSFTIKYEITDSTLLEDMMEVNIINIGYVNANQKNKVIYDTDYLNSYLFQTEKGDWNQDYEFNLVDLIAYRMYLAGYDMEDFYEGELSEARFSIVDLIEDNELSILDLVAARKILVGLPIE